MRVLMVHGHGGSIAYWRMGIAAERLQAHGIKCDYYPSVPDDLASWIVENARNYDLIHTGYFTEEGIVTAFAAAREYAEIPWITDLDDDYTRVPEYNTAFGHYTGPARRVLRMQLRISDAVTTTRQHLADILSNDARKVYVTPNCHDPEAWAHTSPGPDHDDIRLMFAGNIGRYGDISAIHEALSSTLRTHPNTRLFFMGCVPDWALEWMSDMSDPAANRAFTVRHADLPTYRSILTHLRPDIFLCPVIENEFNKSKSHIKAYDAAMSGAALITTDWPTYSSLPDDTAIKVQNGPQWSYALDELITHPDLRKRLNSRLKSWIHDTWRIDKHLHHWVDLYQEVRKAGPLKDLSQIVRPEDLSHGMDRSNNRHPS